ncbi:MAG: protein kinase [Myxococcota bacterium]
METLTQVGESWSGYTVLEALGHLGIAERYRVRAPDGRLHLMDVVAMQHPNLLQRLQEADLQRIVHPNLLSVRDVVPVLRLPGVVCADSTGTSLERWRKAAPPLEQRLEVLRDVAAGLAALHSEGTPHGLLQPGVVVVEDRGGPFARVGLPGVAAVVFALFREGGAISSSGASLGGASFQSPEQQRNPGTVDPTTDLFALGCLAYWMFAGRSPFAGLDALACYEAARSERYPPLVERFPDVPPRLIALIDELLRANPVARPPAHDVVKRLDAMLPRRWVTVARVWALMLALVVASSAVGLLFAWFVS